LHIHQGKVAILRSQQAGVSHRVCCNNLANRVDVREYFLDYLRLSDVLDVPDAQELSLLAGDHQGAFQRDAALVHLLFVQLGHSQCDFLRGVSLLAF
jgi:hypothetical protein